MNTDPIADMLTRIRNAQDARQARVDIPASSFKHRLAEILKEEGFIEDFRDISGKHQGVIEIKLKYGSDQTPVISELKRLSRPGLRRYVGCEELPRVRNGLGLMILSTSKGVMSDRQARQERVGGEAICAVW